MVLVVELEVVALLRHAQRHEALGALARRLLVDQGQGFREAEAAPRQQLVERLDPAQLQAGDLQLAAGVALRGHDHVGVGRTAAGVERLLHGRGHAVVGDAVLGQRAEGQGVVLVDREAVQLLLEDRGRDIAFASGVPLDAEVQVVRDVGRQVRCAQAADVGRRVREVDARTQGLRVGAGHRARGRGAQHHVLRQVERGAGRGQRVAVGLVDVDPLVHVRERRGARRQVGIARVGHRVVGAHALFGAHVAHAGVVAQLITHQLGDAVCLQEHTLGLFLDEAGGRAGIGRAGDRRLVEQLLVIGVDGKALPVDLDQAVRTAAQVLAHARADRARALAAGDAAADQVLPGGRVVARGDAAQDVVVGEAALHAEVAVAPGQVGTQALGAGLAQLLLQVDACAVRGVEAVVGRIADVHRADDARDRAVGEGDGIAGIDRRDRQHGGRLAREFRLRIVQLGVQLELLAELPLHARVDALQAHLLHVRAVFGEELGVREGAAFDHAAVGAVAAVDLHAQGDDGAVAADPVGVDALQVVVLLAVHRVDVEVQAGAGTEFTGQDRGDLVLVAVLRHLAAQARDQGVVDLLDGQARVTREQQRLVDGGARGQAVAGIARDGGRDGPVAAAGVVAGRAAVLGRGQVRVGQADGLVAGGLHLRLVPGDAAQDAPGVVEGLAGQDRAAVAPLAGHLVAGAAEVGRDVAALAVEGARAAHVDHAGGAAFEQRGRGALADGELGEQVGRQQVEVDLAVGVLAVGAAGGGHRDRGAVQQDLGEAGAQAADLDVDALARDLARHLHARDAVERFGDVRVWELAEVLGEDRILEAGGFPLVARRGFQAAAVAGHLHGLDRALGRGWRLLRVRGRDQPGEDGQLKNAAAGLTGAQERTASLLVHACLLSIFMQYVVGDANNIFNNINVIAIIFSLIFNFYTCQLIYLLRIRPPKKRCTDEKLVSV